MTPERGLGTVQPGPWRGAGPSDNPKVIWVTGPERDGAHGSGREPGWPALRDLGYPQGLLQTSEPVFGFPSSLLRLQVHAGGPRSPCDRLSAPAPPHPSPAGSQRDL